MNTKHSAKFLRTRKMLMVLPALTLPFITIIFWLLGGGQEGNATDLPDREGLNLELPEAMFEDNANADKLSFYKQAEADSLKREELLRNDPLYKKTSVLDTNILTMADRGYDPSSAYGNLNTSPYTRSGSSSEQQIYQKLADINKQITRPEGVSEQPATAMQQSQPRNTEFSEEVDRLQNMMMVMNTKDEPDPEMMQLNATLEKILDIQHPERMQQKIREKSVQHKQEVFAVNSVPSLTNISLLDSQPSAQAGVKGFYGIERNQLQEQANAVQVAVHQTQTLVDGATVRLRLMNDIYINGYLIPAGNFVFGTAGFSNERIGIKVNAIPYNKSIFWVQMEAYDLDGLPGIYMPGSMGREVARSSASNGIQAMEISSIDPSLKVQAAATGINAAKQLFSKKLKEVKVIVKAGHQLLLKNANSEQ